MIRRTITVDEPTDNAITVMAKLDAVTYSEEVRIILNKEITTRQRELEEGE